MKLKEITNFLESLAKVLTTIGTALTCLVTLTGKVKECMPKDEKKTDEKTSDDEKPKEDN